jgi:hypothetical protein
MRPDVPYFIILLCLTPAVPDEFTRQGESATTQWQIMSPDASYILYYFTLSNARLFYSV